METAHQTAERLHKILIERFVDNLEAARESVRDCREELSKAEDAYRRIEVEHQPGDPRSLHELELRRAALEPHWPADGPPDPLVPSLPYEADRLLVEFARDADDRQDRRVSELISRLRDALVHVRLQVAAGLWVGKLDFTWNATLLQSLCPDGQPVAAVVRELLNFGVPREPVTRIATAALGSALASDCVRPSNPRLTP